MTVQTIDGMINEPIGALSTERARRMAKEGARYISSETVIFSVLPIKMDGKPPILEISEVIDRGLHMLSELYNKDVFDQMVEEDGTFTYQIKENIKTVWRKRYQGL